MPAIGRLPGPAWAETVRWCERPALLGLRGACRALRDIVAANARLSEVLVLSGRPRRSLVYSACQQSRDVVPAEARELGAAVVVCLGYEGGRRSLVRTIGDVLEARHRLKFITSATLKWTREHFDEVVERLRPVGERGLLARVEIRCEIAAEWDLGPLARLHADELRLARLGSESAAALASGRALEVRLSGCMFGDCSVLARIHTVTLYSCSEVSDLAPLCRVPRLVVEGCDAVQAVPGGMLNQELSLTTCDALHDVSGLETSQIGTLKLIFLLLVTDLSALGRARHQPRFLYVDSLPSIKELPRLDRTHRVCVHNCWSLDPKALAAAGAVVQGQREEEGEWDDENDDDDDDGEWDGTSGSIGTSSEDDEP